LSISGGWILVRDTVRVDTGPAIYQLEVKQARRIGAICRIIAGVAIEIIAAAEADRVGLKKAA